MRIALLPLALAFSFAASPIALAAETRLHPKEVEFEFEGPFGTYDRGALQRGFQVYKEVCASCHALEHIAFRNLADEGGPGFSEGQAKAIANGYKVAAEPNDKGETVDDKGNPLTRTAILADYFPHPFANEQAARANNSGALPPELSMIVKARLGGPQYIYSFLTGFHEKMPAGFKLAPGKFYNPYFEGGNVSMPATALIPNAVTYSDGTKATIEQEAHDVTTFLAWAADPKMEDRKRMGFGVIAFLIVLAGILFAAYRKVWKDAH